MGHGVQVVPACAWTWGRGIGQSGEKGRKAASTLTPSKRETRQETGETGVTYVCAVRERTGGKPRARWSMVDGSRLGQSAALEVSTRAWRAVMERRRSGRRTDEMDANGMEQKPNTRNAGRDEWVGGGRTRRRRRRESRDRAVCSGKRVLVLRVGLAEEEWRPQGETRWNAKGPVRRKEEDQKTEVFVEVRGEQRRGREWEREGDEKCSRAVPTLLPARRPGWVKRVPWGKAGRGGAAWPAGR